MSLSVGHHPMYIAGRKVESPVGVMDVINPWDGSVVGTVPQGTVAQVRDAFDIGARYKSSLTRYERAEILHKVAALVESRGEEISDLITAEAGLCKKDSRYEIGRACDVFNLAAQMCSQDDGQIFSCDLTRQGKKRKIFTQRVPLTVISAITPFNHPLNQVAHKIAPSVATNNCMVLKPTEKTPLTALMLAGLFYEAGLPGDMLSVVTGLPDVIADEMVTNERAELVTFTGGVPIGKHIARTAGYKRTVLELGGNDPLIVMDDADLDKAADLAVAGAYKNSGQRCTAVKRVLVIDSVADALVDRVVEKSRALTCGDPMDAATDMGTVIDEQAAILFQNRVNDAVDKGATLLLGNQRKGALYSPTVVDHVPFDCELVREETFGPVCPVIRCRDLDDLIAVSNSTAYGLSSGVCTNRMDHMTRFVEELDVGTVNLWEVPGYRIEMSPFGGIKDSGLGYKEGVIEAMKSFTNLKTFSLPWFV